MSCKLFFTVFSIILLSSFYLADSPQALPVDTPDTKLQHKAESDDADAQFELGNVFNRQAMFDSTTDTDRASNMEKAIFWFEKAAKQKHAKATYELGLMYFVSGRGITTDPDKAFKLFITAAELGSSEAKAEVAYCYHKGLGVEKDLTKAIELYQQLIDSKNEKLGYKGLVDIYCNVYHKSTEVADEAKVFECLTKLLPFIDEDFLLSRTYSKLGFCYLYGIGTMRNYNESFICFTKGINMKDKNAIEHNCYLGLATIYAKGLHKEISDSKAREYLKKIKWLKPSEIDKTLQEIKSDNESFPIKNQSHPIDL